ncbi:MAG: hypothetical protein ACUVS4_13820 [Chloroflexaceae bacterium]
MIAVISVLLGVFLGVLIAGRVFVPRLSLLLKELVITRRERDRLQSELLTRRGETAEAHSRAFRSEHDLLAMRRRVFALTVERDAARAAQLAAEAAYRELLAERDRLEGELALMRRRNML